MGPAVPEPVHSDSAPLPVPPLPPVRPAVVGPPTRVARPSAVASAHLPSGLVGQLDPLRFDRMPVRLDHPPADAVTADSATADSATAGVTAADSAAADPAAPVPTGAESARSAAPAPDLDALAGQLYERIRGRLRQELLIDRERSGLLTDLT